MKKIIALLFILGKIGEASYQEPPSYQDFLPLFYYEEDKEQHREFPLYHYFDDMDVENNRENYVQIDGIGLRTGNQIPNIYIYGGKSPGYNLKLLDKDKDGDLFWTIEYHHYLPRNTYYTNQTHEHDWEWVYVIVIEDENGYTPLLASSNSHDDNNQESFKDKKYGRYSDAKYFDFTKNGKFGLLETLDKRAKFYVGNDGNAMYGTRWNLNKIERKRNITIPGVIKGRDNIESIDVSITDFGKIISVPTGGLSPDEFYIGDSENVWWSPYSGIDTDPETLMEAPWARNHWNHPFPSTIDVPDTVPPIVK
ncbi:MAG: NPP1 family protein, partial [bacterium]